VVTDVAMAFWNRTVKDASNVEVHMTTGYRCGGDITFQRLDLYKRGEVIAVPMNLDGAPHAKVCRQRRKAVMTIYKTVKSS
jgi:hypothetical protein